MAGGIDLRGGRRCGSPVVLMHSRGDSQTMDQLTTYADVVADVKEALLERSEARFKPALMKAKSSGIRVSVSPRPTSRTFSFCGIWNN